MQMAPQLHLLLPGVIEKAAERRRPIKLRQTRARVRPRAQSQWESFFCLIFLRQLRTPVTGLEPQEVLMMPQRLQRGLTEGWEVTTTGRKAWKTSHGEAKSNSSCWPQQQKVGDLWFPLRVIFLPPWSFKKLLRLGERQHLRQKGFWSEAVEAILRNAWIEPETKWSSSGVLRTCCEVLLVERIGISKLCLFSLKVPCFSCWKLHAQRIVYSTRVQF